MRYSRKTLCFFTAALFLLCGCSPSLRGNPAITVPPVATATYTETPAQNIQLTDNKGDSITLFDYLGSPVLLQFWPDLNALSDSELDAMQHAYMQKGDDIVFLLVCPAPPSSDDAFSKRGLLPLLCFDADGAAAKTYEAEHAPATIFIDADGFIVTQANETISQDALFFGLDLL